MNNRKVVSSLLDKKRVESGMSDSRMGRMSYENFMSFIRDCDPAEIAKYRHIPFSEENNTLKIPFLGDPYYVHWPEGSVEPGVNSRPDYRVYVLLLRYLEYGQTFSAMKGSILSSWATHADAYLHTVFEEQVLKSAAQMFATREQRDNLEKAVTALGGRCVRDDGITCSFEVFPGENVVIRIHGEPAKAQMSFSPVITEALDMSDQIVLGNLILFKLYKLVNQIDAPVQD